MQQPLKRGTSRRQVSGGRPTVIAGLAVLLTLAACTSTAQQSVSTPQVTSTASPSTSTAPPTLQERQTTESPSSTRTSASGTSIVDGATAEVEVAVADAEGQPMPGYTIVEELTTPVDCSSGSPNPSAVGVNTHDCSPHAASAHACWGATGSTSLVCSWNPRSKELRRYRSLEPLTDTPAATDPVPWALDLANGLKCDLVLGGAFGGRADGYHPAYTCDDKTTFVLTDDTDGVIDKSGPQWLVKTGGLAENDTTALPPPTSTGVVTAYFAATGSRSLDSRARSTQT